VLSFDSIHGERDWPAEVVQRLELLSEVFAGALERKRVELSLAERLRFETLLSEQTAIFQAFYTTKADGLGMGLAIARSIVEAHGGRLEARNDPEGGATVSFTVPVGDPGQ